MNPSFGDNLDESFIEIGGVKLKIPPHGSQNVIPDLIDNDIDV